VERNVDNFNPITVLDSSTQRYWTVGKHTWLEYQSLVGMLGNMAVKREYRLLLQRLSHQLDHRGLYSHL